MIDYEDMILARQELEEIYEDDPDFICDHCDQYDRCERGRAVDCPMMD